jgi:flagellar biogenesis protein FliO
MELGKNTKMKPVGGVAGWLLGRLRAGGRARPRLELLERIALAPRQSLSLVEAEGRRFLVATSPEGAPAFYALDERRQPVGMRQTRSGAGSGQRNCDSGTLRPVARVSW